LNIQRVDHRVVQQQVLRHTLLLLVMQTMAVDLFAFLLLSVGLLASNHRVVVSAKALTSVKAGWVPPLMVA
jgi:hypothetical protein